MLDVIKQYMVSIGANVDKKSFANAEGLIKKLGLVLNIQLAKDIFKVAKGMAEFANEVAQADRKMSLLARRMMTTKENARSLNLAMKAMNIGSLDELREIGLDPEAKKQFLELKALARTLENPKYAQTMKEVRALNFEFQKMQVRLEYFKMELVGKMLDGLKKARPYIQKFVNWLSPVIIPIKKLIEEFKKNSPKLWNYAIRLVNYLSPFLNIIRATIIMAVNGFRLILKYIDPIAKTIKTVLDPFIEIFKKIEDFLVYLTGGKSYWEKLYDKWAKIPGLSWMKNARQSALGMGNEEQQKEAKGARQKGIEEKATKQIRAEDRTFKVGESYAGFKMTGAGTGRNWERLSPSTQVALSRLEKLDPELAKLGLSITSAKSGTHKGEAHGKGLATDIQGSTYAIARTIQSAIKSQQFNKYIIEGTTQQIKDTVAELNKMGIDPRAYSTALYPDNYRPVAHIENKDLQQLLTQNQSSNTATITNYNVTVIGDKNPKATVDEFQRQLKQEADTGIQ